MALTFPIPAGCTLPFQWPWVSFHWVESNSLQLQWATACACRFGPERFPGQRHVSFLLTERVNYDLRLSEYFNVLTSLIIDNKCEWCGPGFMRKFVQMWVSACMGGKMTSQWTLTRWRLVYIMHMLSQTWAIWVSWGLLHWQEMDG